MRAKDAPRLSVLRLLKAALKNATIEKVGTMRVKARAFANTR